METQSEQAIQKLFDVYSRAFDQSDSEAQALRISEGSKPNACAPLRASVAAGGRLGVRSEVETAKSAKKKPRNAAMRVVVEALAST